MSVVPGQELVELLDKHRLVISPVLSAEQIGDISVDVRLGNVALVVRGGGLSYVDPREYLKSESSGGHSSEKGRRQKLDRYDIPFGDALLLHPGTLTLVPTLEWFRLPQDLKGVVTARSSWAREGLSIATATFIDPGYTGVITLELANLGRVPIALYPGMRVAQIAFYRLTSEVKPSEKKKHRQFQMSFEPHAGYIAKGDEKFIADI